MNKDTTFSLWGSRGRCLPHLNCRLLFLPILMKSGLRGRLGAPCKLVEFCWLGSVISAACIPDTRTCTMLVFSRTWWEIWCGVEVTTLLTFSSFTVITFWFCKIPYLRKIKIPFLSSVCSSTFLYCSVPSFSVSNPVISGAWLKIIDITLDLPVIEES